MMTKYTSSDLLNSNYVAHYTSFNKAVLILINNKIKINCAGSVNDPYENCIDWFETDPSTNSEGFLEDEELVRTQLKTQIKLFCTTKNDLSGRNTLSAIELGMANPYFAIPNMWTHYGDNHRGVCLIFDKDLLSEALRHSKIQFIKFDVRYEKKVLHRTTDTRRETLKLLTSNFNELKVHVNSIVHNIFNQKNECWAHEQEYRWLVFDKTNAALYIDYCTALKGIILGSNFDFETGYDVIKKITSVPIYDLEYKQGRYNINSG
ncbi:DUF2971 domain-containing protein [Legionella quinlivanii]|uniref:DUF2971 domain-containing protein n=1 Tax=Legionella quinlivanii TaxID=45073 RepID=UPI0022433B92|nr:DUF2971 domain-containing protein [Legionella quinlivanii]MCW8452577.1 DUF2971 domain-containing protein [Legionella quinlivanii]